MGFCLVFNTKMRHTHGGCSPQEMLEEGWTGVESHCDALLSSSSLRAANQSRLLLLTSMDLAQHMSHVWGDRRGTLSFPTRIK